MPVRFENYSHSFHFKGKPVFAPSKLGRRIGCDIKDRVERAYSFDNFYYHLRKGGHVAAIHSHRSNRYFCKLDIENFFYSIARNRVVRSLREISVKRATHYGKWSCVKNPFLQPSYSIPYGFVQSPILASLVLAQSEIGQTLRKLNADVNIAVYVDDISMSANKLSTLNECFSELVDAFSHANFELNPTKTVKPCSDLSIFNCNLQHQETRVLTTRIDEFNLIPQPISSQIGFDRYCKSVEEGNG